MRRWLLGFFSLLVVLSLTAQEKGRLTVTVTGLKVMGDLRVSLFDKADGFPGAYQKAFAWKSVKVTAQTMSVVFEQVPAGTYAVAVLHDENGNGKADTNFLGIPKEGVGISNNPKSSFGPPSFKDGQFAFNGSEHTVTIAIRY